jgi:hypothetical protein
MLRGCTTAKRLIVWRNQTCLDYTRKQFSCKVRTNFHSVGQKMNAVDALPDNLKKKGRPKGSGKMTLSKYADNPQSLVLPKTENQKIKELKELLINSAGSNVVIKAVEIAMNDEHPAQMAALKLCMDRMLPVSLFEKEGKQRSSVNITISGIGGVNIGENPVIDAEDIESKDV